MTAFSTFEEDVKGSIEPGKLADFAVVYDDPLTAREDQMEDIRALVTVVDGAVAHAEPAIGLDAKPGGSPA